MQTVYNKGSFMQFMINIQQLKIIVAFMQHT